MRPRKLKSGYLPIRNPLRKHTGWQFTDELFERVWLFCEIGA